MQIIFYLLSSFYGGYFLLYRRKIDYSFIAYFSAILYFLPGFWGYTNYLGEGGFWQKDQIIDSTYLVFIVVLSSIFFLSLLQDAMFLSFPPRREGRVLISKERILEVRILALLSLTALVMMLFDSGEALFLPDKQLVLDALTRSHILFYSSVMLGFVISFSMGLRGYFILFVLLLGFNTYIGFRSNTAIAILALMVCHFGQQRKISYKSLFKFLLVSLSIAVLMFLYKTIGHAVKSGNWHLVYERVTSLDNYIAMITKSEPFVIQANLNTVLKENYNTPLDHVLALFQQFILFSNNLGVNAATFNSYFQKDLFSEVNYGMASNIWAQMWSAGGWLLFVYMVLVFNILIIVANYIFKYKSRFYVVALSPIFIYWVFYIHRNDLGYLLNLQKRLLLIMLFVVIISKLLRYTPLIFKGRQK